MTPFSQIVTTFSTENGVWLLGLCTALIPRVRTSIDSCNRMGKLPSTEESLTSLRYTSTDHSDSCNVLPAAFDRIGERYP